MLQRKWGMGLFVLLLVLAVGAPGQAQEADAKSEEDGEAAEPVATDKVEYVEVNLKDLPTANSITTKLPVDNLVTPANVGQVSRPLLEEQDARVLGDALRNVSGVNPQPGAGVFDYFVLRGFNSENGSLLMFDGAAEPEAGFYPMYNIEGVEVFKGPAGFLYGKDPLGGAVNLVRKQPMPARFGTLGLSYGSFDTREGTLDWNVASGQGEVAFRVNALWREADNYRDNKPSEHTAINPALTWRINERNKLNFNIEYARAKYSPDSGIPLLNNEVPDVPRTNSYQSPFDFSDQKIGRFQVDFESKLSEWATLRNKTYFRTLDWRSNGTLLTGTDMPLRGCPGTTVCRNLTMLDDDQQFIGNQLEAVFDLGGGAVTHSLLAGVELQRQTDVYDLGISPLPSIDIFDPVETADTLTPFPLEAADATTSTAAPYIVDQMKFGSRFQLLLGVRYDWIKVEEELRDASRTDGEASPMLGFVYQPNKTTSLYLNTGSAFAPAGPRVAGDLDPERSQQAEIGVKNRFLDGRVHTTFAIYGLRRENIPITDPNGFTQQAGDQTSQGVEFEVSAEPMSRLRTFFTYAYNESELTNFNRVIRFGPGPADFFVVDLSGNVPAYAPEHLLNLWVSRGFENGLTVGGGVRFIGEQFIDADNLYKIDGAVVLDALIAYRFKKFKINLNLKNFTNKEYDTRGFQSFSVTPANPFAAYVGVEFGL